MTHPRESFCDQSAYEMLRRNAASMQDVYNQLCDELKTRDACPGEVSLLADLDSAVWSTTRCCRRIETHASEQLQYGKDKHPQRYSSEEDYPEHTAESRIDSTQA